MVTFQPFDRRSGGYGSRHPGYATTETISVFNKEIDQFVRNVPAPTPAVS